MQAREGQVTRAGQQPELTVLTVANLAATVVRFLLLRSWVFRNRRHHQPGAEQSVDTLRENA